MPTNKEWKNVTLRIEQTKALSEFQKLLGEHLGFYPTMSQTLAWLIQNGKSILKTAAP